jgi:hypothetical protein
VTLTSRGSRAFRPGPFIDEDRVRYREAQRAHARGGAPMPGTCLVLQTWGDPSVSSCGFHSRANGPGTSAGAFSMARSLSGRIQGVLGGVPRGPVGPPGPRELAALLQTSVCLARSNMAAGPGSTPRSAARPPCTAGIGTRRHGCISGPTPPRPKFQRPTCGRDRASPKTSSPQNRAQ